MYGEIKSMYESTDADRKFEEISKLFKQFSNDPRYTLEWGNEDNKQVVSLNINVGGVNFYGYVNISNPEESNLKVPSGPNMLNSIAIKFLSSLYDICK